MANGKGTEAGPYLFVALLVATQLLLVDRLLARAVRAEVALPDFRFLSGSLAGLSELEDDLRAHPVGNIFFIGDSTVRGESVRRGDQTVSYGFQHQIARLSDTPRRAVNLGMTGAPATMQHLLLRRLIDTRPEYIFQFVNYRALGRLDEDSVYRYWLTDVNAPGRPFAALMDDEADAELRRISLYRNRHWVFGRFFGAPPWQAARIFLSFVPLEGARRAAMRVIGSEPMPVWTARAWSQDIIEGMRRTYAVPQLTADSPNIAAIAESARLAKSRGISLALVFTPMNREMIDSLALLDEDRRQANMGIVRRLAQESETEVLDATDWMPSESFADTVHLTGAGNLAFGARLAEWYAERGRAAP